MALGDPASLRTVVMQLRSLSADPDSQPIIARDEGCLRALVSFVRSEDAEVARIAVGALKNLSSHPGNYELLRSEDDLLNSLCDFVKSDAVREDRREAFDVMQELTDGDDDGEMDKLDELEALAGLRDTKGSTADVLRRELPTVRLKIPGISDEMVCMRVEQLLVRKSGVISVVFEIGVEVAVVFTRLPAVVLAQYLSTMTGKNVEMLPEKQPFREYSEKENEDEQSGYLDRNGRMLHDSAKKGANKYTITQGTSSLHERLRVQREEGSRRTARANRLMDSIGVGLQTGWGLW